MSTFSVGIVISEFDYDSSNFDTEYQKPGTTLHSKVRVWARPDFISALKNVTTKVFRAIKILEEFWGCPYPLPKLDLLALPNYQATRPADNWGLLLFK